MRRRLIAPVVLLLTVSLVGCGGGNASDNVTQPKDDLSQDNLNDPATPDTGMEKAAAACNEAKKVTGRAPRIVTTVAPITNLVGLMAAGTSVEVTGIVPEGTNSHTFEPPPSAASVIEKADVVFVNGLGLEDPTLDLAEANAKNAAICEIGTATMSKTSWIFDFSFPIESGKPNPHVWTNPFLVLGYLNVIRDVMVILDPSNTDTFDANYIKLSTIAMQLDEAIKTASATIPSGERKLLTYHDAYAYFADRYGYEVVGAIQPQSFEEPSPKDIATLIEQVKKEGVKAVFGSEVFPSPVLEQIGKETGIRYVDTLRDDDLVGKPGDAKHSWAELMRSNYITMVTALGGNASALKAIKSDIGLVDKAFYPQ
jgi:manganese/iron transport system substrate-binding protein